MKYFKELGFWIMVWQIISFMIFCILFYLIVTDAQAQEPSRKTPVIKKVSRPVPLVGSCPPMEGSYQCPMVPEETTGNGFKSNRGAPDHETRGTRNTGRKVVKK